MRALERGAAVRCVALWCEAGRREARRCVAERGGAWRRGALRRSYRHIIPFELRHAKPAVCPRVLNAETADTDNHPGALHGVLEHIARDDVIDDREFSDAMPYRKRGEPALDPCSGAASPVGMSVDRDLFGIASGVSTLPLAIGMSPLQITPDAKKFL